MASLARQALEAYALAHYEEGGHWVVECFSDADYARVLVEAGGDVAAARAALREHWERMVDRERDCAFDGGEF